MVYIYIIRLKENKFFVGKSLERRRVMIDTNRFKWLAMYSPEKVVCIIPDRNADDIDTYTLQCMKKHGIENVRGSGALSRVVFNEDDLKKINELIDKVDISFKESYRYKAEIMDTAVEQNVEELMLTNKNYFMESLEYYNDLFTNKFPTVIEDVDEDTGQRVVNIINTHPELNNAEFVFCINLIFKKMNLGPSPFEIEE